MEQLRAKHLTVRQLLKSIGVVTVAATFVGCGAGSGSPTTPSPPPTTTQPPVTTPPPATNRNPVIGNLNVSPGFGVAGLTSFAMTTSGSDPDGDAVTFEWDFGDGSRGSGPAFSKTYGSGGVATIRVIASDGKGGTATDSRTVTVGSMTGSWVGTVTINAGQVAPATLTLTQAGGVVTGTMTLSGFAGRTDPAQPGRLDSAGTFDLRMKVDPFTDFNLRGTMDVTGRRISGGAFGSGFNGQAFSFDKR
jgi:hypothetical protein